MFILIKEIDMDNFRHQTVTDVSVTYQETVAIYQRQCLAQLSPCGSTAWGYVRLSYFISGCTNAATASGHMPAASQEKEIETKVSTVSIFFTNRTLHHRRPCILLARNKANDFCISAAAGEEGHLPHLY